MQLIYNFNLKRMVEIEMNANEDTHVNNMTSAFRVFIAIIYSLSLIIVIFAMANVICFNFEFIIQLIGVCSC